VLRWPGNFLHFLWLLVVLILGGLLYGLARLGIALFIWGPRRKTSLATLRGWWLRQMMTTLGATFIKLGQVMSTRPDLFEPQIINQLRRLQDKHDVSLGGRSREQHAGADRPRRVHVVSAGVHDAGCLRREVEPRLLLDGERIDVAAKGDGGRTGVPTPKPRHHAGAGHPANVLRA
jgi:hypothetical protein